MAGKLVTFRDDLRTLICRHAMQLLLEAVQNKHTVKMFDFQCQ